MAKMTKIKYISLLILSMLLCLSAFLFLFYESMFSTAQFQVHGLTVKQDDTSIVVDWDDAGASGYTVFLMQNKEKPLRFHTDTNSIKLSPDVLGKDYKIVVTAENEHGGLSAAVIDKIQTEKVKQDIQLEKKDINGLIGKKQDIEADVQGDVTYKSDNNDIVSVTDDGTLDYEKEGNAKITVSVAEDEKYEAVEKTFDVMVYPDTLPAPKLMVKEETGEESILTWEDVEYAEEYVLEKYDFAKGEYEEVGSYDPETKQVSVERRPAKYRIKAKAEVNGEEVESDYSEAETTSPADSAETYDSSHILKVLDLSNLDVVAQISGSGGADIPQSMSHTGDNYTVTFVNGNGTKGVLKTYSKDGEHISTNKISDMGCANGATYNPNTGKVYTVKTHKKTYSKECVTYDAETGEQISRFDLPKITSGIAYDEDVDKYYLSKGNELYIVDSGCESVEKFYWKKIRYNHAQDIGTFNGVIMVCTWVKGNTSYIDLYRVSDGEYIGSYDVSFGEIESCFVDDGYLVILMNNASKAGDCILRTKERISIP